MNDVEEREGESEMGSGGGRDDVEEERGGGGGFERGVRRKDDVRFTLIANPISVWV